MQKQKFQWRPLANGKMKSLQVLRKKYWLAVDVSKVGQGSAKKYVDSSFFNTIIDKQGEAIGRLHHIVQNVTKCINIRSTKMGGMGKDLKNGKIDVILGS